MRNRWLVLRVAVDHLAAGVSRLFTLSVLLVLVLIILGLLYKSIPILTSQSILDLLFSSVWKPMKGQFGFFPFIVSTIYVTVIAITISVPFCILASLYLTEYAPRRWTKRIVPFIDLLAGLPSVIYGIWGVIAIVPFVRDILAPAFGYETSGYCILTGGIVLAVMVIPVLMNIMIEVLRTVPIELKEATLSLGATKWETTSRVVLRKALPGVLAAVVLAFFRAFGETIAVLMVVGNTVMIPKSLFDPGYPLPALIANNYGEMMSIPKYDSALLFSALLLFVMIVGFNWLARFVLKRTERYIV